MQKLINGRRYMDSDDAQKILGYSVQHIQRLCRQGKLRAKKIGKYYWIDYQHVVNNYGENQIEKSVDGSLWDEV